MNKSTLPIEHTNCALLMVAPLFPAVCFLMLLQYVGEPLYTQQQAVSTQVFGGQGGSGFLDSLPRTGGRVIEVQIWSGNQIDSVQFTYALTDGRTIASRRHGGSGGRPSTFQLYSGEYIVGISGRCGDYIDSLRIHTNMRTSQLFGGGGGGRDYRINIPSGNQAVGFVGRAGDYLDAIGLVYVSIQQVRSGQVAVAGGGGGSAFSDRDMARGSRISEIRVGAGERIDSIQAVYTLSDGRIVEGARHGGGGGRIMVFRLDSDEYITGISGRSGDYVDSLRIHTNKQMSDLFGGGGGSREYRIDVPSGNRATGFVGRSGNYLDAIGLNYSVATTTRPAQRLLWPRRR